MFIDGRHPPSPKPQFRIPPVPIHRACPDLIGGFIGEGRHVKSETGDGEETGRTILSEARINTD